MYKVNSFLRSTVAIAGLLFAMPMCAGQAIESQMQHDTRIINIARLNDEAIASHTEKIRTEMRWNKLARLGVEGAKWGIGLFTVYKILQSFGLIGSAAATPVDTVTPVNEAAPSDSKLLQRLTDLEVKVAKQIALTSPNAFSLQWFKNAGYVLGEHLLAAIAAGTIYQSASSYINDGILHKGDISWFIGTKTNLLSNAELVPIVVPVEWMMSTAIPLGQLGGLFEKDMSVDQRGMLGKYGAMLLPNNNLKKTIFEELKSYAAILDQAPKTELEKQPVILVCSACNSLVSQIESILGFMAYKQESFGETARTEAASSSRYIYNVTQEFCQKIEDVFNAAKSEDPKTQKNQLESLINSFKNDIARLLISFSRIEKEQNGEHIKAAVQK